MGKSSGGGSSSLQQIATIQAIQSAQQQAAQQAAASQQAAAAAAAYKPPTPQASTAPAMAPYLPSTAALEASRNAFNARLRGQEASILGGQNASEMGLTQQERENRRKNKLASGDTTATQATATAAPNTYTGSTLGG